MSRILIVDDEPSVRFTLEEVLTERGHVVVAAVDGENALTLIHSDEPPDVVITDLAMPKLDGLGLLSRLKAQYPDLPVVMLTARGSERAAVEAMRAGAYDYLTKPCDIDELGLLVERAVETSVLRQGEQRSRAERWVGEAIIGQSAVFRRALSAAQRLASRDVTVLVRGETGTGKELFATVLHAGSARAERPLVRFNCGAIPEALAEAEAVRAHARCVHGSDGGAERGTSRESRRRDAGAR